MPFVFNTLPLIGMDVPANDELLSELMVGYWGNFAHRGDPNSADASMTTWPDLSVKDAEGKRRHFLFKSGSSTTVPEQIRDVCPVLATFKKT